MNFKNLSIQIFCVSFLLTLSSTCSQKQERFDAVAIEGTGQQPSIFHANNDIRNMILAKYISGDSAYTRTENNQLRFIANGQILLIPMNWSTEQAVQYETQHNHNKALARKK